MSNTNKLNTIKNKITAGNFSVAELNAIVAHVQSTKLEQAKSSVTTGAKVNVIKNGRIELTGTVVRVKLKKAIVRANGNQWDVPLSMIEVA